MMSKRKLSGKKDLVRTAETCVMIRSGGCIRADRRGVISYKYVKHMQCVVHDGLIFVSWGLHLLGTCLAPCDGVLSFDDFVVVKQAPSCSFDVCQVLQLILCPRTSLHTDLAQ